LRLEPSADPSPSENKALPYLLIAVSVALAWILLPFYGTLLWGAIIAMLFTPVFQWLLPRCRFQRAVAAALTVLLVLLIAIIPVSLLSIALGREAMQVYQSLQTEAGNPIAFLQRTYEQLPDWALNFLNRLGLGDFGDLRTAFTELITSTTQVIGAHAISIGQNTFEFILAIFLTMYIAFFLIKDGNSLIDDFRDALPLAPQHKKALINKFVTVIRATVKGNLLVAIIQGAMGGVAFWFLGVSAALLWAVVMAFLSLLPAVGAALVWLPVAVSFAMSGELLKGLALTAWGVLVIGLIDNFLRPMLVGRDTRMPDYVILISTLGGMAVLGINGFVIGPVIAAMFIAVWHIYVVTSHDLSDPSMMAQSPSGSESAILTPGYTSIASIPKDEQQTP
jgi:predicted PurR-regulated permease PerM